MERRQNTLSKHMRYDIIKFKPNVDVANAWFSVVPTASLCLFVFVVVYKGHFGVAVRKILENH